VGEKLKEQKVVDRRYESDLHGLAVAPEK
jgi:hypothetical protein